MWPACVCLCGCELLRVNRWHNCIKGWSFLASTTWGMDTPSKFSVCECDLGSGVSCKPPLGVRWVVQPAECGDLCGQRWFTASCILPRPADLGHTQMLLQAIFNSPVVAYARDLCFWWQRNDRCIPWFICGVRLHIYRRLRLGVPQFVLFLTSPLKSGIDLLTSCMSTLTIHCYDMSPPTVELSPLSCRPQRDGCFQQ